MVKCFHVKDWVLLSSVSKEQSDILTLWLIIRLLFCKLFILKNYAPVMLVLVCSWIIFILFVSKFQRTPKASYPIHDHFNITGHTTAIDNFSILAREDQKLIRTIKEALYIRVNNPSLKETKANTICPIYGMRFCKTPQNLN